MPQSLAPWGQAPPKKHTGYSLKNTLPEPVISNGRHHTVDGQISRLRFAPLEKTNEEMDSDAGKYIACRLRDWGLCAGAKAMEAFI